MPSTTLLVKNMVCHRCVMVVEDILRNLAIDFKQVIFGEIYLHEKLTPSQKDGLVKALNNVGFELIDNHSTALIEKVKQLVLKKARNEVDEKESKMKLSHYLTG